jgi:hypothetical protein
MDDQNSRPRTSVGRREYLDLNRSAARRNSDAGFRGLSDGTGQDSTSQSDSSDTAALVTRSVGFLMPKED